MSENPFSSKPTIVEGVEQDEEEQDDETESENDLEPAKVQEDYDEIDVEGEEVKDSEMKADEEWAQTPTGLFASLDQDRFWWVFVTLEDSVVVSSGEERGIPVIEERFPSYNDLEKAKKHTDKEVPEGIHVQNKNSNKIRYVKGQDEQKLLEGRGIE
jgi:hypothetical protein